MSIVNDEDTVAAVNWQLEEDEREALEAERLQQADVRFELPAGLRGAAGSVRGD